MSFRCQACNQPQLPGTRPHRVVVKTREKECRNGRIGTEIVEEQNLCDDCIEKREKENR